jgi:cytidylate kinase
VKIAISGKSGCGNSTVTALVAEQLGFRPVNYTFKDMAHDAGITFDELRERAEHDSHWDRELDKKQVEMASAGNTVLGSRLAIWVLKDADLRVYLDATVEVRAGRIRKRKISNHDKPNDFESVLDDTIERDQRDHDRYLRLYGIDNDRFEFADLIIDANEIDENEVAGRIVSEAKRLMQERQAT